jgi:chromosomal replication initiation ATPase DnaA
LTEHQYLHDGLIRGNGMQLHTQITPTQMALYRDRQAREARIRQAANRLVPPKEALFQEVAQAEPEQPKVDPYREQFAEAWKMLGESGAINTIDPILRACCYYFKISKADLVSPRRSAAPVLARQVAMYLCRHLTIRSLPEIGRWIGGRDHTTVLHSVRKIERVMATDERVARAIRELTSQLAKPEETICEPA